MIMSNLTLIRHGESMWNKKNIFTGWIDIPLSLQGIAEAQFVGEKLANTKYDIIFVSTLIRSIETAMIVMSANLLSGTPVITNGNKKNKDWSNSSLYSLADNTVPVIQDWRLNERYYGNLQGKNKKLIEKEFGAEQLQLWRRSFDTCPPCGESLKDTSKRTTPFFKNKILPLVKEGKNVLVVAHGNSLRAIIMFLDKLRGDEIVKLELGTGVPIDYQYTKEKLSKLS